MRLLFGMILGALLTIGGAYISDTITLGEAAVANPDRPSATVARTMVNWDVVGENWRAFRVRLSAGWNRLTNSAR
jgi:hypothetical protein